MLLKYKNPGHNLKFMLNANANALPKVTFYDSSNLPFNDVEKELLFIEVNTLFTCFFCDFIRKHRSELFIELHNKCMKVWKENPDCIRIK
jgi:hypothetical protein